MTRIIITGRNSALPSDAAQSMAHLMPTPWPSFSDRLTRHMEQRGIDDADKAICDLVWRSENGRH